MNPESMQNGRLTAQETPNGVGPALTDQPGTKRAAERDGTSAAFRIRRAHRARTHRWSPAEDIDHGDR